MKSKLIKIFLLLLITAGVCYGAYAKDVGRLKKNLLSAPKSEELGKKQRYIVIFKEKPKDYKKFVRSLGGKIKYDYTIIEGIAVEMSAGAAKKLAKSPNVKSIQEDQLRFASLSESVPLINADNVQGQSITGAGVKVCIVDTGIDDGHSALNPLVAEYDFVNNDNDATDDNGHGTHVAGIVASQDATYKGVAPGASLMAAKVLDASGLGWESDVIAGIDWCKDNGADVINLSLGGSTKYTNYCDAEADAIAINNAVDAGVAVVVASGNNGWTDGISSPACASKTISVGDVYDANVGKITWGSPSSGCTDKTTAADQIVCHSNRGATLDLLAPGAIIDSAQLGGGFVGYGGTSMAAPHTAGAVALLLETNQSLTSTQIENVLKNTGVAIFDEDESELTFPRIDALAAYNSIYGWPLINQIQCEKNAAWTSCDNISSGDTLTRVRANCADRDGTISNVNFKLTNIPDSNTLFDATTITSEGDWWIYDNANMLVEDSGEWKLLVTATDNDTNQISDFVKWAISWGYLQPYLINPTTTQDVAKNKFFTFQSGVECVGGECGDIEATLTLPPSQPTTCSEIWNFDCGTGPPETGGDNTFDSCGFGAGGDESIDEIHLNKSEVKFGEEIEVTCDVIIKSLDCGVGYVGDQLYIYYRNNPTGTWQKKHYVSQVHSCYNYSIKFIPDSIEGEHQVRCIIGYDIPENECGSGSYYDNDDANFSVYNHTSGKGKVPMDYGSPFYTTSANPQTCLDMQSGETCEQTWNVKATGDTGTSHKFFTIYEPTTYASYIASDQTSIVTINIAAITLFRPDSFPVNAWQMISVPLEPTTSTPEAIIGDDVAGIIFSDWMLGYWKPAEEAFQYHRATCCPWSRSTTSLLSIVPGLSYWLATRLGPYDIDATGSLVPDNDYYISILPGWNQIGVPFNYSVAWASSTIQVKYGTTTVDIDTAQSNGWMENKIWWWDGAEYQFAVSSEGQLDPWSGYWVYSTTSNELIISPTPILIEENEGQTASISKNQNKQQKKPKLKDYQSTWKLRLMITADDKRDTYNFVGMSPKAENGYDAWDVAEPPAISSGIALYFPHLDWPFAAGNYAQDMKKLDSKNKKWYFEVKNELQQMPITLKWLNLEQVEYHSLSLTDLDANQDIDLYNTTEYTFDLEGGGIKHFELTAQKARGRGQILKKK